MLPVDEVGYCTFAWKGMIRQKGMILIFACGQGLIPGTKICSGDKTVLSQSKLFCPNDVGDKIVLSRDYTLPARGTGLRLSRCLSGHTKIFFSIERD